MSGRRPRSLAFLLSSFFGALLIAGSFSYYNYKFSQFKFINFNESVMYTEQSVFEPKREKYIIFLFDSRTPDFREKLAELNQKEYTILAIDLNRERFPREDNIIFVTSGIDTLLTIIQRFNIYEVPSAFGIERHTKIEYKQTSQVEKL